ncbi:hypothetical protein ACLB2K_012130 [Fragaria x ananassa]
MNIVLDFTNLTLLVHVKEDEMDSLVAGQIICLSRFTLKHLCTWMYDKGIFQHGSGTNVGGGTFWGSERLLTKCKSFNELLESSQVKTFEAVVGNSVVQLLWTTMIDGYAGWGCSSDAMELFDENGVEPNEVTMIAVLSACSSKGDVGMGKEVCS